MEIFKPVSESVIHEKYNLQSKFIILGVASIWSRRKGLNDFIELSRDLNLDYQIILVGLSKTLAKDLPSNIISIEKTESVLELANLYSASDVFVNPTWEDNFPTTNIEALACGTPVITYKTGGSPEAIDIKTGFVVEKGDIKGLYNAIEVVRQKGKNNFSKDCRERAVKLYDKNKRYQDYINLYNSKIDQ